MPRPNWLWDEQYSLTFLNEKYCEYDGQINLNTKGLNIGGYEPAWLADLVASFLLDQSRSHFDHCFFDGIYHDDGFGK
jgi:hypothetical protein